MLTAMLKLIMLYVMCIFAWQFSEPVRFVHVYSIHFRKYIQYTMLLGW